MKTSTQRLEAFSDGIMAIIITIMALNIPLPTSFNLSDMIDLLSSIGIFFVSFVIVGAQWNKHHILFSHFQEITNKTVWINFLFLFFLTLIPLFTKWVMQNPTSVIPALGYDVVFLLVNICYQGLFHELVDTNYDEEFLKKRRAEMQELRNEQPTWHRLGLMIILIVIIVILSLHFPDISIIFFILMPILFSLWSLLYPSKIRQRRQNKHKRLKRSS